MNIAIINQSELDHLRQIEKEHQELLDKLSKDGEMIVVQSAAAYLPYKMWIKNPDRAVYNLQELHNKSENFLKEVLDTEIPVFNRPGKKVRDLKLIKFKNWSQLLPFRK
jgi:hypothetical protein